MPGPPRSIKAVVDSQDAVVVSWLPPATPNGKIQQYNIYVREVEYGREGPTTRHQRGPSGEQVINLTLSKEERDNELPSGQSYSKY